MSLYPYKIVETIVEYKSFKKAAEELNLTASAVSHAVSNLESELGFPLFRRTRSGIFLTEDGERLLPFIRQVSLSTRNLNHEVERINHHEVGLVRVGAFYSVAFRWLPDILREFNEKYPDIDVTVYEGSYDDCLRGVDDSGLDLSFTTDTAAKDRNFTPLLVDPLLYITPESYRPKHDGYVTADEIRENRLIMQRDGDEYDALAFMSENNIHGDTSFKISENLTVVSFVESGFGACIMPRFVAETAHCRVRMWPIHPEVTRTIGMTVADPSALSPAVRMFQREVRNFAANYGKQPDALP